jgi:acyl carrier protein
MRLDAAELIMEIEKTFSITFPLLHLASTFALTKTRPARRS